CGGLMYLARAIRWHGERAEMVGVIPAEIEMGQRPVGRGYVKLRETGRGAWPLRAADGALQAFHAHEFHYSRLVDLPAGLDYAYAVERGQGIDGRHDGLLLHHLLASYAHLRDVEQNRWAARFVDYVRRLQRATPAPASRGVSA
ncbi:MAG TPA: cobyrinic acid a,c-diamide synthase, partial [Gammaproteobacteria bacterium]